MSKDKQVGGTHYTDMGIQPLEATLANFGYEGLRASVYTKVNKYLGRDKGGMEGHIKDLKKAVHCIEFQIEMAEEDLSEGVKPQDQAAVYVARLISRRGEKIIVRSAHPFD